MLENYQKAKNRADRSVLAARLRGKHPYLVSLEENKPEIRKYPVVDLEQQEVPLDMVVGTRTAERSKSFSADFLPVLDPKSEFASKWEHVYHYQTEQGVNDPVLLYEYNRRFYVEEGNKRVSVLKYIGARAVLGKIKRIMPPKTEENQLYYEFVDFYAAAPLYDIAFSETGRYRTLAKIMGENLERPWPKEKVKTLKASFAFFLDLYRKNGGAKLNITPGDAYLVYIRFYGVDSLLTDSTNLVRTRINKLWAEFLAESAQDSLDIVDDKQLMNNDSGRALFRKTWTAERPLQIAFLFDDEYQRSGWLYGHELGRRHLDECFEGAVCTKACRTGRTAEELRNTIDAAVADGANVIFTLSPSQMAETSRAAIHYPQVMFLNCSLNMPVNAVRTYYGRMYEAKFLMGMLAGMYSENHKVGYAAGYPIYGTIANINAFAIGVSMTDPKAKVYLRWMTQKDESEIYRAADPDIRIFSGHDLIKPERPTREYGLYGRKGEGIVNIACPVCDWGKYYEYIVGSILDGRWQLRAGSKNKLALNYWLGMPSGVIDVVLSNRLPYAARRLIMKVREAIVDDFFHPFEGELHSQTQLMRKEGEEPLSKEEIVQMRWLNENVIGEIPRAGEISEHAIPTVSANGLIQV